MSQDTMVKIISKLQPTFTFDKEFSDEETGVLIELKSCFYCGNEFKGDRGLNVHLRSCKEKVVKWIINF